MVLSIYNKVIQDVQNNSNEYLTHNKVFNAQVVYDAINSLEVLPDPAKEYLNITENQYIDGVSDHILTLQHYDQNLVDTKDRLMIDHVDGFPEEPQINFEYAHKDAFDSEGNYLMENELHILEYSFQIISAISELKDKLFFEQFMANDALVSLIITAYQIEKHTK